MRQTYIFTAINELGHKISGEYDALDENDLDEYLKRVGLELRSFREKVEPKGSVTGRAKTEDMLTMCTEMSLALRACIPLMEALDTVRLNSPSMPIRGALTGVREEIRRGRTLVESLSYYPKLFNDFFLGLIAIGEKSGHLAEIFSALGEYNKWMLELKRRFIKVVSYPLASACFTTGVIWMLLIHLVCFVAYRTYALPDWMMNGLHTIFSDVVIYYWYVILFGPMILIYAGTLLYRNVESIAYQMDRFFLTLPVLGEVIGKLNTARYVYFFSVMFNAGLGIEESMRDAEKTVRNRPLRESFAAAADYLRQGHGLAESIVKSQVFPPLVEKSFRIGEETGNIGEALESVNYFYRRQVDDVIDAFADYLRYALLIMAAIFLVL